MNAQGGPELPLSKAPLPDVPEQIPVEFGLYFDLQSLRRAEAKIIEQASFVRCGAFASLGVLFMFLLLSQLLLHLFPPSEGRAEIPFSVFAVFFSKQCKT